MDRDPDRKESLMAVEPKLSDQEIASLMEIPHPSKGPGESIYGKTKVFPDYQAEPGETRQWLCHCALPASLPDRRRRPPFPAASYETGHYTSGSSG